MKMFILIIVILFSGFSAKSQSEEKISIQGKLYKFPEKNSDCGVLAFASVMEFEVIKVNSHNYDKSTVLVIVPCPELYGEDCFKINGTYELSLIRGNSSDVDYILVDDLKRSQLLFTDKEFWATEIFK